MENSLVLDILALVCDIAIVAFTAVSMGEFWSLTGGKANMKVKDTRCFEYFTVDSNILVALTALIMIVFDVQRLVTGAGIPYWATLLKFIGTVAVSLTFFVVMLILAPYAGYKFMLEGCSLYMHLITPVIAMITFVLFDGANRLPWYTVPLALLPTVIYGIVYFIKVVIIGVEKGGWEDFYGFNKNGRWYLSCFMMLLMTSAIAVLLLLGHNAMLR